MSPVIRPEDSVLIKDREFWDYYHELISVHKRWMSLLHLADEISGETAISEDARKETISALKIEIEGHRQTFSSIAQNLVTLDLSSVHWVDLECSFLIVEEMTIETEACIFIVDNHRHKLTTDVGDQISGKIISDSTLPPLKALIHFYRKAEASADRGGMMVGRFSLEVTETHYPSHFFRVVIRVPASLLVEEIGGEKKE